MKQQFYFRYAIVLLVLSTFTSGSYSIVSGEDTPTAANSDPIYNQLRNAPLSGEVVAVQHFILERDKALFSFDSGEFHLLTPVAGRVTGAVFIGQGTFQFTPVLAAEQWQLSWLTGSNSITDTYACMVLRFTDDTAETIRKSGRTHSGAADPKAQDILDGHRKLLRNGRMYDFTNMALSALKYNLDLRILLDVSWKEQGGVFSAFIDGKQYGELLFTIDPLGVPYVTPEEVSLVNLSSGSLGVWVAEHLAEHYHSGSSPENEDYRLMETDHVQIEATCKKEKLTATVKVRFTARMDGVKVLPFNLFPKLRVSSVTDADGAELSFIQEDQDKDADLAVILPAGLTKGQSYTLRFQYSGQDAISDEGGGNFTLIARDNWYPNSSFGDRATYEMAIRAPKNLTVVATGQPLGDTLDDDFVISRWKTDFPIAVAGFNYGKFQKSSVQDDKLKYTFEAYANKYAPDYLQGLLHSDSAMAIGSLDTVQLMDRARTEAQVAATLYTDYYGPLPFGRLAITQQPYPLSGQAWPLLIYMPLTAFFDSTQLHALGLSNAFSFLKYVAAHETAHQWWGHLVGWKSYRDQWLSEGAAEFSASLYSQAVFGNEKFLSFWRDARKRILEKIPGGVAPAQIGGVTQGVRLDTPRTGNIAPAVLYSKGAYIFHMLRMLMWEPNHGNARFKAMMSDFIRTFHNMNASTVDFQHVIEKHMVRELDLSGNGKMDWFFKEWVEGTLIPDYKLNYRLNPTPDGRCELTCTVTQGNVNDAFAMSVPIYLDYDGKITRLGLVKMYGNSSSKELKVILPQIPKRVLLCAYEDVLCTTDAR